MLWRPEPLIQKSEQRWSSLPGCVIYMLSNKEPLSLLLTYLFAAKTEAKPRKLGEVSYENIFSLVLFLRPWPNSPSSFPYLTVLTQSRLWSEEQVSPATSQVGSCLKATDRCWNDQGNKWLYLVFCKILLKLELNHTTLLNDLSQLVLMCNQRYGWQELPSALQGQILHAEMVFCPSQLHGLWLIIHWSCTRLIFTLAGQHPVLTADLSQNSWPITQQKVQFKLFTKRSGIPLC